MNPSDTHISRMAMTFAERSPFLRSSRQEAVQAWLDALEIGRDEGVLEKIEQNMVRKGLVDPVIRDAWMRAREY